jgi:hypothetical protein
VIAALGGGGVWFMGSAWGTGAISVISLTVGSLLSGFLYSLDLSLPWMILSGALVVLGVLFITKVKETGKAEE